MELPGHRRFDVLEPANWLNVWGLSRDGALRCHGKQWAGRTAGVSAEVVLPGGALIDQLWLLSSASLMPNVGN